MTDARSRPRTGDVQDAAGAQLQSIEEIDLGSTDGIPSRDWSRSPKATRSDASLLVHWIDEKGSVVRLISSSGPDTPQHGTSYTDG